MPLPLQSTVSSVIWGKRPREGDEESFVRFSELSPAQKLERRRQERQEKKEKQRTIAYFESMQRALAECQQNVSQTDVDNSVACVNELNDHGGNNMALVSLIDGFFSELFKLLRADVSFNLLRNNVVCKTIDAALANATLLHSKSLLHLFLGHAFDLITSPVASYTVEMLLMSFSQSLNTLKCNGLNDDYTQEMTLGSSGMHVGSGVANTITLLSAFVEEVVEHVNDIVCHEIGARALRSVLLILAGHSLHNAPQLQYVIRFDAALDLLTDAIVGAFYEITSSKQPERNSSSNSVMPDSFKAYNMWMSVAHASTTLSLIAQSLLKISVAGSKATTLVQSSMEHAVSKVNNKILLVSLLHDDKGVFLFQTYITVPTPTEVISMCNLLDFSDVVNNMYSSTNKSYCDKYDAVEQLTNQKEDDSDEEKKDGVSDATTSELSTKNKNKAKDKKKDKKKKSKCKTEKSTSYSKSEEENRNTKVGKYSHEHIKEIFDCAWVNALNIVVAELPEMLNSESNEVQSLSYVLQDLTLYAPSSIHLGILWRQIIEPNLTAMFEIPLLAPVLTNFVKKCAFNGNSLEELNTTGNNMNSNNSNTIVNEVHVPADIIEMLRHDKHKGITFFDVPLLFQIEVVSALSTFMLSQATKGAIHFLLVENKLGNKGSELARYLLHVHFIASVPVQNSMDKLRIDDLLELLRTHKGSVVMQQFVRSAAQREMCAKAELYKRTKFTKNNNNNNNNKQEDTESETIRSEDEREALRALPRFVRRILPHLSLLASDTFAAFVIEVLYDVGDVELKEQLLHGLVPLYESMKKENYAPLMKSTSHNAHDVNNKEEVEEEVDNSVNPLLLRQRQFILRKVLRRCCVEQFVHRNADWRKSAERQAQVHRLMYRILLQPTN